MSGDGVAEQPHRAGVGMGQTEQHPDEGRLSGTVGTQVAERASPGHQELDAVHRDVLAEPLGEPVGLDGPLTLRIRAGVRLGGHGEAHRADPTVSMGSG